MQAIIMAGGRGTRLRPLTNTCPKPMIPFINKPVLAHLLNLLRRHHITDIVMTVHYLAEQIEAYFGDGREWGLNIRYAYEDNPLGTAGGVKNAASFLNSDPFLVISGDIITDIDLSAATRLHQHHQGLGTLILKHVNDVRAYGAVTVDQRNRICSYSEKPHAHQAIPGLINTGIYILQPTILDLMEPNQIYDFSYHIFPILLDQPEGLWGYIAKNYWSDMGTLESYRQTLEDAFLGKINGLELPQTSPRRRWLEPETPMASQDIFGQPSYASHSLHPH